MFSNPINKIERFIYMLVIITLAGLTFNFKVGKDFYEKNTTSLNNSLNGIKKSTEELEALNYQQDSLIEIQINLIQDKEQKVIDALNAGTLTKEEAEKQINSLKSEIDDIKKVIIEKNKNDYIAALSINDVVIQRVTDTIIRKEFKEIVKYEKPDIAIDSLNSIFESKRLILVQEINRLNQEKNKLDSKVKDQQTKIEFLNTEMGGMASKKLEIKNVTFSSIRNDGSTNNAYSFNEGSTIKNINVLYKISKSSTLDHGAYEISLRYFDQSGNEIYASRSKQNIFVNGTDSSPYTIRLVNQNGFRKGTHTVKFYFQDKVIDENSFTITDY